MVYYSSDKILIWDVEFNLIVCGEIWYDLLTSLDTCTLNVYHWVTSPDFDYKPVWSSKNCYLAFELQASIKPLNTLKNFSIANQGLHEILFL